MKTRPDCTAMQLSMGIGMISITSKFTIDAQVTVYHQHIMQCSLFALVNIERSIIAEASNGENYVENCFSNIKYHCCPEQTVAPHLRCGLVLVLSFQVF